MKFQLRDEGGNNITTASASIYLTNVTSAEINGTSSGKSNEGNLFRYDTTENQYIFNLATKPLSAGTWQIRIELDDGTSKYVNIGLE